MTTDIAALKAAALACDPSKCADEAEHERRLGEFYSECEPEDVLGLIAENERLRGLLAPVADGIQQKRQRWLDNIAAAIRVGLPKSLRQDLGRTYAEIQSSIQHGGGRNLLAEIERLTEENSLFRQCTSSVNAAVALENDALRQDAERYRGVRRVANRQGFTDEQFDQQTDARLANFEKAMAKVAPHV